MQLPQGMAYGWWHFAELSLRDLTFRVQIDGDTNRSPGRYLQLYQGKIGSVGFYLGFQTDVHRPQYGWQGHGLVFSRWDTRDSNDARVATNGWIENAGHEGNFVGVRVCYLWSSGEYDCALVPVDTDSCGTWYEFMVTSKNTDEKISAGCLRFTKSEIMSGGGSWTEVYSAAICESDIPFTEMRIVDIAGNNGSIRPIRCDTTYNQIFGMSDAFVSEGTLFLRSGGGIKRTHEPNQYILNA